MVSRWGGLRCGNTGAGNLLDLSDFTFCMGKVDSQSRTRVLSRVVRESYECITPRSILKDVTTKRQEQFGADATQSKAKNILIDSLEDIPSFSRGELIKQ